MEGEDPAVFEELESGLNDSMRPVGALEEQLVGRVAGCLWRLRRIAVLEGDVLAELGRRADVEDAARIHNVVNLYGPLKAKQPWQAWEGKEELSKAYDAVRAQDFRVAVTARAGASDAAWCWKERREGSDWCGATRPSWSAGCTRRSHSPSASRLLASSVSRHWGCNQRKP